MYTVTSKTKSSVSILLTTKTGRKLKITVKDKTTFNDAISYIQEKSNIINLLKECAFLFDAVTIKDYKRLYAPNKKQLNVIKKNNQAREQWYKDNEKLMNKEIEKMVNHPGFMGTGVSRQDIESVADKEVLKLYGV